MWLAELSALRNAELLARPVAASLGLPDQAAGDPGDLLADYPAARHRLLILDTCEHLVDACAKLAEALLPAAPRLRILATSREPLGVRGEQTQLISPFEVPDSDEAAAGSDSVALFAVCCLTGELDRAISLSEECLRISEELGEQWSRGTALWTRGAARWLSGHVGHAVEDTLACLRIKESLGDLHTITMAIDLLAVRLVAQDFARAAGLCGAGDAFWKMLRAPIQQGPY